MNIVEETRKFAKEMSEKYNFIPPLEHTELTVKKGLELAEKLKVNSEIVLLGCYLMDIGLGKAFQEGKIKEHVKMSIEIAKEFLNKFDLDEKYKEKIINCVAAHHGEVGHVCLESEIVKNADNFRFLDPEGIVIVLYYANKQGRNIEQVVKKLKDKIEEKYKLVTLDICKREVEENYKIIKEFLSRVKI